MKKSNFEIASTAFPITVNPTVSSDKHVQVVRLVIKRLLDIAAGAVGLLFLTIISIPLFFIVRRDGGTLFYSQDRIGKNGKIFTCWKIRTMHDNADVILREHLKNNMTARQEWAKHHKLQDDPRLTRVGQFLRKKSLDEWPQFWNIMRGDMSFVGPRPILPKERKKYGAGIKAYESVKPGLTGLWQVSGRNEVSYQTRIALDRLYIREWTLLNDLKIIGKTFFVVLSERGAY